MDRPYPTPALKGVTLPIWLLSWAFPVDEAVEEQLCGTR